MTKLLIIEDHMEMVRAIQKSLIDINHDFGQENTFCFTSQGGMLRIEALEKIRGNERTLLYGKQSEVYTAVFSFLEQNANDNVLILIDVLLNSQNISAPSYERYRADAEYSCELYAELLRIKNGKKAEKANMINPENFFTIMYSRSDASIGVVVSVLDDLYHKQNDSDREYFPRECTLLRNISWCRNCCDTTDENFNAIVHSGDVPLLLPKEYVDFIAELGRR